MTPTRRRLGYQPSLDGLRAVAVALVVLDHAGLALFEGWGQVGVTMFFVLSGFLITTLLLEERQATGRINLQAFYLRRAMRLLPALILLLAGVSALLAVSGRADEVAVDVLSTLFYVRNWFTALGENPAYLSHAWSLSIEEQFYLLWPLLLLGVLAMTRGRIRFLFWTALTLAVASAAWRFMLWQQVPAIPYYRVANGTDTRIDALFVGCALGALAWWRPIRIRWPAGLVALLVIGAVSFGTDYAAKMQVGIAVVALATGVLVIACRDSRLLAWRPLVYTGSISYGIYLFHRPIARTLTDHGLGGSLLTVAVIALLTMPIAIASYRYVERPALRLKRRLVSTSRGAPAAISATG